MGEPVRVLVVDDSSFFRKRVRQFLEASPRIQVVGEAADGSEAIALNARLSPDLVTMDVAMPVLDGISAVRRIMQEQPTKVIMFSALTRDGARSTLDALEAGAVDFVPKLLAPGDEAQDIGPLLRERVLDIAGSYPVKTARVQPHDVSQVDSMRPELLIIGASTGGPIAVQEIISQLPADYPLPILVAVHMPEAFTPTYAERLNSLCALKVQHASDGDALLAGKVLIAPGGYQTLVENNAGSLRVRVGPAGNELYKPSIDLTFKSAAQAAEARVLGVVLTGMGADGREGALALKASGSRIWTQDQASSVVYGMPQAVNVAGASDKTLALRDIAPALRELC